MIPFPKNIDPRVWTLINALCDGTISEQETHDLESLLEADAKARDFYVDFLSVNAEILWLMSAKQHSTMDSGPVFSLPPLPAAAKRSPVLGFLGDVADFFNHHAPLSIVLLVVFFGTALLTTSLWLRGRRAENVSAESTFVAHITAAKGCQWSTSITPPTDMMRLQVGQQLQLEKGMVQITYSTRATVLLEGPASFTVASANSGFISQGKLTARAETAQSRQFTIVTPAARFVDLGTEFGVMIDERGRAAAAVFSGKVKAEAKLPDGRWIAGVSIREGEAVVCEAASFTRFVAQRSNFPSLRPLPPPPPETPFQRWQALSREMQSRKDLLAYYDFQPDPSNPEILLNRAPTGAALNGKIQNAWWTRGRFPEKNALDFTKDDAGVRINLPGKHDAITLIAWVNRNSTSRRFSGILLSDNWNVLGQLHWQLHDNGQMESNIYRPGGRSPDFLSSKSIPSDCLNQWCMIAVTINRPDQTSVYVNGELLETLKSSQLPAVEIGSAMIGGWDPKDSGDKDRIRNFAGSIDELMIFQNALSAEDIRSIYERGKPGDLSKLSPNQSWLTVNEELRNRPDVVAYYDFQPDPNNPDILPNRAPSGAALNGEIQNAVWTQGRFAGKGALEFKRKDSGVLINLPNEYRKMTLIAWIRIGQLEHNDNCILMSDSWERPKNLRWEIFKGGHIKLGVLGQKWNAVTERQFPEECFNTWCMVAGVITPPNRTVLYLNGEPFETFDVKDMPPIKLGSATIGGCKDYVRDASNSGNNYNLPGRMDELVILQAALSAEEIKRVYEAGKP